ncbi:hypothetical protein MKZ38_006925 [Zalerion maritima]|uniref:Cyanovirin-N domain-containing protein n=1 Tax=Zalerion maritima TaxID=339359 RepID=A0AAD5RVB3_9PEZI|nr:hypothetical protein MKZ38_006925 [Zalerion maritima]
MFLYVLSILPTELVLASAAEHLLQPRARAIKQNFGATCTDVEMTLHPELSSSIILSANCKNRANESQASTLHLLDCLTACPLATNGTESGRVNIWSLSFLENFNFQDAASDSCANVTVFFDIKDCVVDTEAQSTNPSPYEDLIDADFIDEWPHSYFTCSRVSEDGITEPSIVDLDGMIGNENGTLVC